MSIAADPTLLEANAAVLRIDVALPGRGVVDVLRASPKDAVIHRLWWNYVERACSARGVTTAETDVIGRSLVHLLGNAEHIRRAGSERGIDDRSIVKDCITYAEEVDRLPSLGELCLAAHVSERRLRGAFQSVFELPPSQFFRKWALGEAHRRLSHADCTIGVTEVAVDLGFNHLGRFAHHYATTFDEPPSATLRRSHKVLDEGR